MESIGAEPDQPQGRGARLGRHDVTDFGSAKNQKVSYGYINEHFMMGHSELAAMRRRIVECSQAADCELTAIYVERVETSPDAWRTLLERLGDSDDSHVVIVPGLHHLAGVAHPVEARNILLESGAKVHLADQCECAGRVTTEMSPTPRC